MTPKKRFCDSILTRHHGDYRQMAFVTGPRQVGKTTTCRNQADAYLNWDNLDDRELILSGPGKLAERLGLDRLRKRPPTVLFDELHKHPRWKQLLKGFFDTYGDRVRITVTGSARMDTYRRGGDSLMGRYFLYRMHPFTVAETLTQSLPDAERIVRKPGKISAAKWGALWTHGGYPEPFLKRDIRFTRRWQTLRQQQLLQQDVRDLTQIQQLGQMEVLYRILANRSGRQLIYSNLAREIRTSIDTIRRWIETFCRLHVGFLVRPWFTNVARSLRKEPKWFMRDWSTIDDPGQRAETFIACHLLKAVEGWTDLGLGEFQLGYLRDSRKREVDFIVARDSRPWFLVEAKHGDESISPSLRYFQGQTQAPLAFQVAVDADYVPADCFSAGPDAITVPARTFLSQLL